MLMRHIFPLFRLFLNSNRLISACSVKRSACSFIQRLNFQKTWSHQANVNNRSMWRDHVTMVHGSGVTNALDKDTQILLNINHLPPRSLLKLHLNSIQLQLINSSSLPSSHLRPAGNERSTPQRAKSALQFKALFCRAYRKWPCSGAGWVPPPKEYTLWTELQWSH